MKSWYPATYLNEKQVRYIQILQNIWNVYDANMDLVPYKLAPHQIHWHSRDIAVLGKDAKNRIVVKSRNTSFTTSSLISNLMAVPHYPNQILPFVRLNQQRAYDLLEKECKPLIRNMTPLIIDGKYYPFDPREVQLDKAGSIKFPNGVEFRAMPANASSAETIRGMRIFGSAGINDESNFMMSFKKIYIATRDASRGGKHGEKEFQMNIGTTRKGRMTQFNMWFEEILKNNPDNFEVFWWPVLEFDKVDLNRSLLEQDLTPIVDWHSIEDLENKRKEDINSLKEEYMTLLVDAEDSLYPFELIESSINSNLQQQTKPSEQEQYTIGIDPAATSDLFAVSIFEASTKEQKFLHYSRKVPLKTMESFCDRLIEVWKPLHVRIDGNGLGYQIGQNLKNKYPNVVEVLRGAVNIKAPSKVTGHVPLKEYLHTNLLKLMNYNNLSLIEDETQTRHFMMWNKDYSCSHDARIGHGDIVIANALALLPNNFRTIAATTIKSSREKNEIDKINKEKVRSGEDVEW